jgi:hypothetical protein
MLDMMAFEVWAFRCFEGGWFLTPTAYTFSGTLHIFHDRLVAFVLGPFDTTTPRLLPAACRPHLPQLLYRPPSE